MKIGKGRLLAGVAAVVGVAGGGAAIGATELGSPQADSQAVLDDAARQLGIQPSRLSDALEQALVNHVEAEVAAGRLTRAEANALDARIRSGELPLLGGLGRGLGGHVSFGGLDAAASYLGLTEAQLQTELEGGKSLAQVAQAHGKSVDGLVQALADDAKSRLDAAVAAGRLTQAQADAMVAELKQRIANLVDGRAPNGFRPFDRDHAPDGPVF